MDSRFIVHLQDFFSSFGFESVSPNHDGLGHYSFLDLNIQGGNDFVHIQDTTENIDEYYFDIGIVLQKIEQGLNLLMNCLPTQVAEIGRLSSQ